MAEAIETEEKDALAWAAQEKVKAAEDNKTLLFESIGIGVAGAGVAAFAANRSKNSPGTRQVS